MTSAYPLGQPKCRRTINSHRAKMQQRQEAKLAAETAQQLQVGQVVDDGDLEGKSPASDELDHESSSSN